MNSRKIWDVFNSILLHVKSISTVCQWFTMPRVPTLALVTTGSLSKGRRDTTADDAVGLEVIIKPIDASLRPQQNQGLSPPCHTAVMHKETQPSYQCRLYRIWTYVCIKKTFLLVWCNILLLRFSSRIIKIKLLLYLFHALNVWVFKLNEWNKNSNFLRIF